MPIEFLIFLTVFTPALVGGLNLIFNKKFVNNFNYLQDIENLNFDV